VEHPRVKIARIQIRQEELDIFNMIICLPLIDLFMKTTLEEEALEYVI
jgi:hypothetical protein